MALTLIDLPQDVLILIFLHSLVEDVLALMQTCRVMHALGSLDYLWHGLISDWDIPLDVPLNASPASLSSDSLRLAAVKSLKRDNRWRNPRLEMRRAQCIVSQNSSFVDGMRFLPGGRWLVTLQYEPTSRTHITLWSIPDATKHNLMFKVTVVGRVRFLHAHHHHQLEQITIGIAFARGTAETICVYNVFLGGDPIIRHSLVFEATPDELYPMGRISGMKINGDILIAVFAPLSSPSNHHLGQIVCLNLVSRATAVFECLDWSFTWAHLKIFCRCFAVTTSCSTPQSTTACIFFFELPSVILDRSDRLSPSVPCWPGNLKLAIKDSLIANTWWSSDSPLICELCDDAPTNDTAACSYTIFGYPIPTQRLDPKSLLNILDVSFNGRNIEYVPSVVACRSTPSPGEIRVSSSGKRAVWLTQDLDTRLIKFARGRGNANGAGSCISTLMPSFSGFPFNPRDFHSFVFDEISCKMAVGLPTGELYILHYH